MADENPWHEIRLAFEIKPNDPPDFRDQVFDAVMEVDYTAICQAPIEAPWETCSNCQGTLVYTRWADESDEEYAKRAEEDKDTEWAIGKPCSCVNTDHPGQQQPCGREHTMSGGPIRDGLTDHEWAVRDVMVKVRNSLAAQNGNPDLIAEIDKTLNRYLQPLSELIAEMEADKQVAPS